MKQYILLLVLMVMGAGIHAYAEDVNPVKEGNVSKQSFRAVLCTSIYISTFVPNLNFGQDEHKRRRQVLCLNGS